MAKGKQFEKFVDSLERMLNRDDSIHVEKDAHIRTPQGNVRQIDVLLTHTTGRHKFLTVIKCKDWKRPVDIKAVDEFSAKIKAVNADKGILVSRSGFTSGLIKEALAYPYISLYTIQEIDKAAIDILEFSQLEFYKINYTCDDWTVKFSKESQKYNDIDIYSKLRLDNESTLFDITQMAQELISEHEKEIVVRAFSLRQSSSESVNAVLKLSVNFPRPAYFESDDNKNRVVGFQCIVKIQIEIKAMEINNVYRYHNLTANETVAMVFNLRLDTDTKKLIFDLQ